MRWAHKLAIITKLVQQELPEATRRDVIAVTNYDWDAKTDHLNWLDSATPEEIASWVSIILRDVIAERANEVSSH